MMAPLTSVFVAAQNHQLGSAPWARERLRAYAGKGVTIAAGALVLHFSIGEEGYLRPVANAGASDVLIEVPLTELPALIRPGTDGVKAQLRLDGNADLAETVGFVFRNLRWDIEEDAAHFLGDIAAHRLGEALRTLRLAHMRIFEGARDNTIEYLTEEARLLVTRSDFDGLMPSLLGLRDDIARSEKRVERLSRTIRGLRT